METNPQLIVIAGPNGAGKTTLAKKLRDGGYAFQLMFLWLRSADLAVQRVRERVGAGGHDVPEEVIRRRYDAGLRNFWELYQPLADAWSVYDNSESAKSLPIASGGREVPFSASGQDSWASFASTRS